MARIFSGPEGAERAPVIHAASGAVFGIALMVLVVAGIASWLSVRQTTHTTDDLHETLTIIAGLDKTLSDVTVLQLTGRSYLGTKDSRVLEAYFTSAAAVRIDISTLKALSLDDADRMAQVEQLETETTAFANLLAVGMPAGLGQSPTSETPASGEDVRGAGERVRATIKQLHDHENELLSTETGTADEAAQRTLLVTSGLTAAGVLMLIGAFVAMNLQINRRRVAEASLSKSLSDVSRLNQKAVDANRELEAFCYSVSHDLRAPLRTIDGFSKALVEDFGPVLSDDGQHLLTRIRVATQRMGQLIDDLLGLSRVTRGEFSIAPVNLSSLAERALDELRAQEPNRRVTTSVESNLIAEGDEPLLAVVLDNLLRNAWKYTGKHESAVISFGVTERDGEHVYFVKDDGAGFDMQYSDKLFGVFQRLHHANDFPGTGVGLATVQRIIFRHGGRVWAESAPEKGATFYFTLGTSQSIAEAA
ncbi:MAG: ATP-binding protein [Dehalococcoidia bacterium]